MKDHHDGETVGRVEAVLSTVYTAILVNIVDSKIIQ